MATPPVKSLAIGPTIFHASPAADPAILPARERATEARSFLGNSGASAHAGGIARSRNRPTSASVITSDISQSR